MCKPLTIRAADGNFSAHVAFPAAPKAAPVVVVLHEIFGVNDDMRMTCDELAAHGFIAICPDLFWRQMPDVDLSVSSEADWNTGAALYSAFNRDAGVFDVIATIHAAAGLEAANGKIAVMGYCLGGLMAYLTAARGRVDAAVAYHGGDTESHLGEAKSITAPLLMHLGEEDEFISKDAQARIKTALAGKRRVEVLSYAGCHHAFASHGGRHYAPAAAALANARTWEFLTNQLRCGAPGSR